MTTRELEKEADKLLRKAKAERLTRRQRVEPFDETAGRAMFAPIPGRAKPSFDDNGDIVPVADVDGSGPTWEPAEVHSASVSVEATITFILSAGPSTPEAIARRAAVAGSILNLISGQRAARIAGCHEGSITRLRKKVRSQFGLEAHK